MVVEDNPGLRQMIVDILSSSGFPVVAFEDAGSALAAARRREPQLIISDIEMPGQSGFELIRELRSDKSLKKVPVIVVSGFGTRAHVRAGMGLGADDYIPKPFTREELVQSVQARLERRELIDELDSFAHTVAHDLKGPLAVLKGRLELAVSCLSEGDSSRAAVNLDSATKNAERLSTIIDELLLLAGVRKASISSGSVDMNASLREALDGCEVVFRQHRAVCAPAPKLPPASGHAPWITHIWANFLSNAAKYGGPSAQISIGSRFNPETGRVRYWVKDCGDGIPHDLQSSLFVPFARIRSDRAEGHGLGLSIVQRIAGRLGGSVGLESAPGQGALFWFELPSPEVNSGN
jgi:two-component system, sensor histidine kinase and response regulator